MIKIPLTRGFVAFVDDNYSWLGQWKWHASGDNRRRSKIVRYAQRNQRLNGKRQIIYMHRVIMGALDGQKVDHIDGNGLNNQLYNLQICQHWLNIAKADRKRGFSGYRGVYRMRDKWQAAIKVRGKRVHLGTYIDPKEAAKAYDRAAIQSIGHFAVLNFPIQVICPGYR